MRILPVKTAWTIDTIAPSCANLATQEEPYLDEIEVSQRFEFSPREMECGGLRADELDFVALESELKNELAVELLNMSVPQQLWPNLDRYELRWKFGHDTGWSEVYWIETWLQEKQS